ncbi:MAG: hypothetical protein E6J90_12575 [Deltaproteobacteria bacterium]|nr:MAG: hypothetical protein E6J91_40545 [Deltaproteobacteria bacterium]TMQ22340.1 MAG: hypothetical protein E6J90_12575 [Deltaproteobacteria bacterium]
MHWLARVIGAIGAWFIYRLIAMFGRTYAWRDIAWLEGPLGDRVIGDAPYRDVAARQGLTIERDARDAGLVGDFGALRGADCDPDRLDPRIREFYEHTTRFAMDVWSQTYFPTSIALFLLVTTISRQVNQLNFPLSPLESARGMSSEIIALRNPDGSLRYTGWFRTLGEQARVLYTGFYMTERAPHRGPCVKVVFPMPNGNATVVLAPQVEPDGALILDSTGVRFGDAGFYRIQSRGDGRARVWHIRTLRERFRVYVDDRGVVRCDHHVRFLGLPVLSLHYKIVKRAEVRDAGAGSPDPGARAAV